MQFSKNIKISAASLIAIILVIGLAFLLKNSLANYLNDSAVTAIKGGEYENAKKKLYWSSWINPNNPLTYFYRGKVFLGPMNPTGAGAFYQNADYDSAIPQFEKAEELNLSERDPGLYSILLNDLGFSYWMTGESDKALPLLEKRVEMDPDKSYNSRIILANEYLEKYNKPQEALNILKQIEDSNAQFEAFQNKNLYFAYSLLARLYSYFGHPTNVKKYAELAISSGKRENLQIQIAHTLLAYEYAKEKNMSKALKEYGEAKAINSKLNEPEVRVVCNLARIYFLGGNNGEAIRIAKQQIEDLTSYGYTASICLETLARSYLAEKNTSASEQYARQYLDVTGKFKDKNIFVVRNRNEFQNWLANK